MLPKIYSCEVVETRAVRMLYRVEASSQNEAEDRLSSGETIEEFELKTEGVVDRSPMLDTLRVMGEN